eukprot:scaffold4599_cov219-Amphora_coffeaeformis.AAC.3
MTSRSFERWLRWFSSRARAVRQAVPPPPRSVKDRRGSWTMVGNHAASVVVRRQTRQEARLMANRQGQAFPTTTIRYQDVLQKIRQTCFVGKGIVHQFEFVTHHRHPLTAAGLMVAHMVNIIFHPCHRRGIPMRPRWKESSSQALHNGAASGVDLGPPTQTLQILIICVRCRRRRGGVATSSIHRRVDEVNKER